MFILRHATADDLAALMKLGRMLHAEEFPSDPDEIAQRINVSRDSFADRVRDDRDRRFFFVLEDTDTGGVGQGLNVSVGTCDTAEIGVVRRGTDENEMIWVPGVETGRY